MREQKMENDTRGQVIDSLVEFTGKKDRPVFKDTSWIEDFGLDSLALFHALLHIEKRLGIAFMEDDVTVADVASFEDLIGMVQRRRSEARST
jgi:acyl carrier protein